MRTKKTHYNYPPLHFRWKPSSEIDLEAIQRMRDNFSKPLHEPPKAWFMSGVEYYSEIDAENWKIWDLIRYLRDTLSGISSFGRLKIWVDWFHYLLPDLILRAAQEPDSNLYDEIIEYILILYRHELYEEYLGFRRDVFASLLITIMQEKFWPDKNRDFNAHCWLEPVEKLRPETDGLALEYSMLFCLKFLIAEDIAEWVESIATIESKKWQLLFSGWLNEFESYEDIWNIPSENITLFREEIAKYPQFQT